MVLGLGPRPPRLAPPPHPGFPMGIVQSGGTYLASLGSWMEVSVSFSNGIHQCSFSPMSSPIVGTHDFMGAFQGHLGQDLPHFTEPGIPVGHPERGPVKFVAAVLPFAAVEVQDVLLGTGEQLHIQIFHGVSQLL